MNKASSAPTQTRRPWWFSAVLFAVATTVLIPPTAASASAESVVHTRSNQAPQPLPAATTITSGSYQISIQVTSRFVRVGERSSVWGTVRKDGRLQARVDVRLWARDSGGHWVRTTQHVKTNSRGKYVFKVGPLKGRDYQVRSSGSASHAARVGMKAKVVIAQKTTAVATKTWKMNGRVNATLKGRDVKVQRFNSHRRWVTIAETKVAAGGLFSVAVPAGAEGSRRYRAVVLNPKGGFLGTGYSVPLRVATSTQAFTYSALKVSPQTYQLGQPVHITAKVSSRYAGTTIRAQQITADGWIDVGTGTIDQYGQATALAPMMTSGVKTLRLVVPALDGYYRKGTTATVQATIAPDCDITPEKCTYQIMTDEGAKLFDLANLERLADPQIIPLQHYPTDELLTDAVNCVIENATSGTKDLQHCGTENLYRGGSTSTAESIMAAWMASPAHAVQIMSADNTYIDGAILLRSDGIVIAALAFN